MLLVRRDVAKERSDRCDKGMRELSRKRKELFELAHQQELEEARAEEERKEEMRKAQKKENAEARPLAVGAHGVAKQDGSVTGQFFLICVYFILSFTTSSTFKGYL